MNSGAERFNGLMAMLGIVAGIGAYATTGQVIPGIFQFNKKSVIRYKDLITDFFKIFESTRFYQSCSDFFVLPIDGAFIPSQSGPTMMPTIANRTMEAIPTIGAVGAGVESNPPKIN